MSLKICRQTLKESSACKTTQESYRTRSKEKRVKSDDELWYLPKGVVAKYEICRVPKLLHQAPFLFYILILFKKFLNVFLPFGLLIVEMFTGVA